MAENPRERVERAVDRVEHAVDGHGRVFRLLWAVAGVIVLVAGLAMTVFPGPAIIVVPVGLAMLAAEFAWARRLLDTSVDRGLAFERRLASLRTRTKVVLAVLGLVVVGTVLALLLR